MWKTLKENFETPDSYVSLALGLAVVLVVGMITFNYFKAKMQTATSTEQKAEEVKEAGTLPAKYTVAVGDTLWSIAEKYYKSGYNWVDIQKANGLTDPNLIENGQTLTIPDAKPITMPTGVVSSASTVKSLEKKPYTVLAGDDLWSIAVKMYGDGYRWSDIAQANSLDNPDVIYTGNVLILP
jgi:nucleoid-associated protein YgaU